MCHGVEFMEECAARRPVGVNYSLRGGKNSFGPVASRPSFEESSGNKAAQPLQLAGDSEDIMSALDRLIPAPAIVEVDRVELAVDATRSWQAVRNLDLAQSSLVRTLFGIRTLPDRLKGKKTELRLRLDDLISTPEEPGFRILAADPPHELAVGAIGKVWRPGIPFVHVADAAAFAAFSQPGYVKVAWALRVVAEGEQTSRVELELRVAATDEDAWKKFTRYFRLIGPGSHFIRRMLLAQLERDLGTPEAVQNERRLPGDELIPDAVGQFTHSIVIGAPPEKIWPWLLQMGCQRAGFYSLDLLDNAGVPSAREIHLDLQQLRVGYKIPARPKGDDHFEVVRIQENRALLLGGLFDVGAHEQIPFDAPRPRKYWHVSWAFVLEPLDAGRTRLYARARGAFSASGRFHAFWIRPVHHLMQTTQLRHLAARAEGRLARDSARDVLEGLGGAAVVALALLTPFLREERNHRGLDAKAAAREYPGDQLVPEPRWSWTHGVEIEAPADAVWPWVAQLGADRGGFYSYQWLQNIAGCELRNAETIHPEWALRPGDALVLHRDLPPLGVVEVEPRRFLLAEAAADPVARAAGKPWVAASWLFFVESLGERGCRLISRYRCACPDDVATRLSFGPVLVEPVGFAMDRRMLLGIKDRAERMAGSVGAVPLH